MAPASSALAGAPTPTSSWSGAGAGGAAGGCVTGSPGAGFLPGLALPFTFGAAGAGLALLFTPAFAFFRFGSYTLASRRTRSSISLPGWKVTTFFSGTSTRSLVRGFRARRAFRRRTSNTPKFRSSIRPSLISVSMIASNVHWTISFVFSWVSSARSEIRRTISFLVTGRLPA